MLSIAQTDYIIEQVKGEQISLSHLQDELIDHICCDIEMEMEQGLPFNEAYKRVQTRIGNRGLQKVQEDTLFLIDKNYKTSKACLLILPASPGRSCSRSGYCGKSSTGRGRLSLLRYRNFLLLSCFSRVC